jgi:hypothetical protein
MEFLKLEEFSAIQIRTYMKIVKLKIFKNKIYFNNYRNIVKRTIK